MNHSVETNNQQSFPNVLCFEFSTMWSVDGEITQYILLVAITLIYFRIRTA